MANSKKPKKRRDPHSQIVDMLRKRHSIGMISGLYYWDTQHEKGVQSTLPPRTANYLKTAAFKWQIECVARYVNIYGSIVDYASILRLSVPVKAAELKGMLKEYMEITAAEATDLPDWVETRDMGFKALPFSY